MTSTLPALKKLVVKGPPLSSPKALALASPKSLASGFSFVMVML